MTVYMTRKMLNQMLGIRHAEAHSEPRQPPKTERFTTIINGY